MYMKVCYKLIFSNINLFENNKHNLYKYMSPYTEEQPLRDRCQLPAVLPPSSRESRHQRKKIDLCSQENFP